MAKVKKASREYLVGYVGNKQCLYGPDRDGAAMLVDRMTMFSAVRRIRKLKSMDARASIYQIVPVETKTVAEWRQTKLSPAKREGLKQGKR